MFLFCTNKGLCPRHTVAMFGKKDWSLVFLFSPPKDPLRFLLSLPGCLESCNWPTPHYTHTATSSVTDMSFEMCSQAQWRLSAFSVRHSIPNAWPSSPSSVWITVLTLTTYRKYIYYFPSCAFLASCVDSMFVSFNPHAWGHFLGIPPSFPGMMSRSLFPGWLPMLSAACWPT